MADIVSYFGISDVIRLTISILISAPNVLSPTSDALIKKAFLLQRVTLLNIVPTKFCNKVDTIGLAFHSKSPPSKKRTNANEKGNKYVTSLYLFALHFPMICNSQHFGALQ
jgi:hypothetical protein